MIGDGRGGGAFSGREDRQERCEAGLSARARLFWAGQESPMVSVERPMTLPRLPSAM